MYVGVRTQLVTTTHKNYIRQGGSIETSLDQGRRSKFKIAEGKAVDATSNDGFCSWYFITRMGGCILNAIYLGFSPTLRYKY